MDKNLLISFHSFINTQWVLGKGVWNTIIFKKFPDGLDSKESACNVEDLGSISVSGRSPGGEHGNPLQHSYLEHPTDSGAWQSTGQGVAQSLDMTEQLSLSLWTISYFKILQFNY